ncbi:MAG: FAD:protein FMN transferase [Muribaculaceae bacterium]|nr:FAD:protein FMN transferase [Muribaculaceae bacterium]
MTYSHFISLFFILIVFLGGCKKNDNQYIVEEGLVWNTEFHITYKGSPQLKDSIRTVLAETGHNLSVFDPSSLVSKVNAQDSTEVNDDFRRVYEMSKKIHRLSAGAFDPTLSPLIDAWGFGRGHTPTADTLRIDSLLRITGIDKTRLHGGMIVKDCKDIQFNFSAIAKGYGCDKVAEMMQRNGVTDYLIEIGGEIASGGKSPRGGKWNISIDRPVKEDTGTKHESQMIISISGEGVATSGNYRNYHEQGGKNIGHTISSITGRPIETDVLSATVVAPTAMEADALSTALMATEKGKAVDFAKSLRLPVLLIFPDSIWMSEEMNKLKL